MVKMIFIVMVAVLVVMPMFVGCAPGTQTSPPVAVENQSVKRQTPAVVDNKTIQPDPEGAAASKVRGFVYESFEGVTQIYYMKESSRDRVILGQGVNSQPAWSPDGNTIAFVSYGNQDTHICTMDIDGNNVKSLTLGQNPVWSPDSKKIAYSTGGSLFVMNADGTGKLALASGHVFDQMWSPDGKRLVFVRCGGSYSKSISVGDIFVINADGTGLNNITKTGGDSKIGTCWSPDGQYIAFLSNRDPSDQKGGSIYSDRWNLYVTKHDGSEVRRVNADFTEWTGYAGISKNYLAISIEWHLMDQMYGPYLTWSPDGKYITVCTIRTQGPTDKTFGGSFYTISKPTEQFPVGSLIVFDAQTGKEITAVKAGKRSVCWSPDSKRLCYIPPAGTNATDRLVSYREIRARDLIVMDADGSNPQTIFDCNAEGYLNWHP